MTWSDASRAAALEARRAHARARAATTPDWIKYRGAVTAHIPRWALARDLRAIRRMGGKGVSGLTWGTPQRTMEMAVASTKVRNATRGHPASRAVQLVSALHQIQYNARTRKRR